MDCRAKSTSVWAQTSPLMSPWWRQMSHQQNRASPGDNTTSLTGIIWLHNLYVEAPTEIWDGRSPPCLPACMHSPRCCLCMCVNIKAPSSTHLLHAVFPVSRQPGGEAPLPHGYPATSSRQRRSSDNHPKGEMMREGRGGIIHATCCWYTTEAPPNPLPLSWTVHAPGGLAQPGGASSAGSRRTVQFGGC